MKTIRCGAGLLLLALFGLATLSHAESKLIGEWVNATRSSGGVGETIRFKSDGKCLNGYGAYVPYQYRRDADRLLLIFEEGKTDTHRIVERPGEIELADFNGSTTPVTLKRVRADGTKGLPGKWSYLHYTGKQAFLEFNADGSGWLSVPFDTREGTYKVLKKNLTVSLGGDHETYTFDIADRKLILKRTKNGEQIFYLRK